MGVGDYMGKLICFALIGCIGCGGGDDGDVGGGGADATVEPPDAGAPDAPTAFAAVTGYVQLGFPGDGGDAPAAGARISVVGADDLDATADADGNFTLVVPTGVKHLLFEGGPSHWNQILTVDVGEDGVHFDQVHLVHDDDVDEVAAQVEVAIERDKGAVMIEFDTPNDAGGESASISADSGPSFVFAGEQVAPALGNTLPAGGGDSGIVFPSVAVGDMTATVTGAPGVTTCALEIDLPRPVLGHTMVFLTAVCAAQ